MQEKIGRYAILKEVGRGAMGVVYAATDSLIGRTVAIKTIKMGALGQDPDTLRQRLHREAQSAGVLSHPGIITVYDIGDQGDESYIVMEFVDGTTLDSILSSGVPQHTGLLLSVLRKAADAIDYAHGKGVIHRDIKPSNIMVCLDGTVKISDFGVAKFSASPAMTQTGFVVGTPNYISPEQAQGHAIDGRSDQFSLAVVAYQMMTGCLPFDGPTLTAVLTKTLWEEPPYQSVGMQTEAQEVFQRALAKDPSRRYPTCSEFACALEEAYSRLRARTFHANPDRQSSASAPVRDDQVFSPETADLAETVAAPAESAGPHIIPGETEAFAPGERESAQSVSVQDPSVLPDEITPPSQPVPAVPLDKKRFPALPAVAAVVVLMVLAFTLFLVRRSAGPSDSAAQPEAATQSPSGEPETPVPSVPSTTESASPPAAPATADMPVRENARSAAPSISHAKSASTHLSAAVKAPPDSRSRPEVPAGSQAPASLVRTGVLTWSGKLAKNSILVINAQGASVGTLNGRLPGVPIEVKIEPKEVTLRQEPSADTGWTQLMLYTGAQKCSSITVRWTAIK